MNRMVHYTEITYTKKNGDVVTRRYRTEDAEGSARADRLIGRMKNCTFHNSATTFEKWWDMEKVIIKKGE